MITKLEAASLATSGGVAVVLASAADAARAVAGEDVGTLFHITGKRDTTRLKWLAHAAKIRGELVLDDGAVRAVEGRRRRCSPRAWSRCAASSRRGTPWSSWGPTAWWSRAGSPPSRPTRFPRCWASHGPSCATLGEHFARPLVHIDDLIVVE